MLKKIMKSIGCELLKIDWNRREKEEYDAEQKKQRDNVLFARIMHAGQAVHDLHPTKLNPWDTLPAVADNGMYEERMNGKVIERGYIDSNNWGGMQS